MTSNTLGFSRIHYFGGHPLGTYALEVGGAYPRERKRQVYGNNEEREGAGIFRLKYLMDGLGPFDRLMRFCQYLGQFKLFKSKDWFVD